MRAEELKNIFTPKKLADMFPAERSNDFFEALFGDASEGAYDIELNFKNASENAVELEFLLKQRPGKCLVCNLTYGLPQVFSRHPVINVKKVVADIAEEAGFDAGSLDWTLGNTREISRNLHSIPLKIKIKQPLV